jgi:hypothetical protein
MMKITRDTTSPVLDSLLLLPPPLLFMAPFLAMSDLRRPQRLPRL